MVTRIYVATDCGILRATVALCPGKKLDPDLVRCGHDLPERLAFIRFETNPCFYFLARIGEEIRTRLGEILCGRFGKEDTRNGDERWEHAWIRITPMNRNATLRHPG